MLYGLSVTGTINLNKIYKNNTIRKDDVIILTKPLGMGILTTALKKDLLDKKTINIIINILSQLNFKASNIMKNYDVSACTDVTGFGLAGHAYEMCKDNFTIEFDFKSIPIIKKAKDFALKGIVPAGSFRNKNYLKSNTNFINSYDEDILFFDAQTSGGLLMSVSQNDANKLLNELHSNGYEYSKIIGIVKEKEKTNLIVK